MRRGRSIRGFRFFYAQPDFLNACQAVVAHALPETESVAAFVGEDIIPADGKTRLEKGDAVSVPFAEGIGQQAFDGVLLEGTDGGFFVTEQP